MFRSQLTIRAIVGHMILPFTIALLLTFFPLNQEVMIEGSEAFFNFSPAHSLGYPIFLAFLSLISPEHMDIAYLQVWIYAFTVFVLALGIYRISTNHFFALLCVLCLLLNPFILNTHFAIQPDSLFISTSLMIFGFLLHAIASHGFFALFGFGISIGVAITLCPFGMAYLPLLIIAPTLFLRKNHCSFTKAFLVPALSCIALISLEASSYHTLHNNQEYTPAAANVFASAALMNSNQQSPYASKDPRTALWEKVEQDLQSIRNEIWQEDDFRTRSKLLLSQQQYVSNDFAINALTQAGFMLDKSVDDIRMDIASSRIVQDPLAFLEITLTHYRRIWASDNMLSYPFWAISLLTSLIGLWFWIRGKSFNGAFALAFISAFAVQCQTILSAHIGIGPANPLMFFSPLLSLNVVGLLLGFYMAFINPPRTNG
ncbi:MAG: hypothetical protein ACNI26_01920 [Terasakiella sp.]|uniref:hypothetical protein n=1 Tax=unclassified Terasakiella TaxID=2614952 RepID=UPI003AFFF3B1